MAGRLSERTVGILVAPGSSKADVAAVGQGFRGVGARPLLLELEREDAAGLGEGWERRPLEEVVPEELDGVVVPGGIAGADRLRVSEPAVELVRQVFVNGKPVGAIGHGVWLLIESGIAAGRVVAAPPGIRTGLVNAGGALASGGVRVERDLVTARGSEELADFVAQLVWTHRENLGRKGHEEARVSRVDRVVEQSFPASDPAPGPSYI